MCPIPDADLAILRCADPTQSITPPKARADETYSRLHVMFFRPYVSRREGDDACSRLGYQA
jgi:hypothetical protein